MADRLSDLEAVVAFVDVLYDSPIDDMERDSTNPEAVAYRNKSDAVAEYFQHRTWTQARKDNSADIREALKTWTDDDQASLFLETFSAADRLMRDLTDHGQEDFDWDQVTELMPEKYADMTPDTPIIYGLWGYAKARKCTFWDDSINPVNYGEDANESEVELPGAGTLDEREAARARGENPDQLLIDALDRDLGNNPTNPDGTRAPGTADEAGGISFIIRREAPPLDPLVVKMRAAQLERDQALVKDLDRRNAESEIVYRIRSIEAEGMIERLKAGGQALLDGTTTHEVLKDAAEATLRRLQCMRRGVIMRRDDMIHEELFLTQVWIQTLPDADPIRIAFGNIVPTDGLAVDAELTKTDGLKLKAELNTHIVFVETKVLPVL